MRRYKFAIFIAVFTLFGFLTTAFGDVLMKEVISREFSIQVGRTGPNEIKEVISREASLWVNYIGDAPFEQCFSREMSFVVTSYIPPSPITDINVTLSPTGEIATLDWSNYNQWAEGDIDHFDIYYTAQAPFDTVPAEGLTQITVPAESTAITIENLPAFNDHYFAIVPVDALGNSYSKVNYSAGYVLSPEIISREVSLFIGEDEYPQKQVISRELTLLKPDSKVPEPVTGLDSGFFVVTSTNKYSAVEMDWTSYNEYAQNDVVKYNIYYNTRYFDSIEGMTPFKSLPAETRTHTLAGLTCDAIFHFAVVAEDSLGNFDSNVRSFSMKVSTCFLGEVENLSAESGLNNVIYTWEPPPESESFLSHYNVYFGGSSTAEKISADQTSWTGTELLPATSYHFQIKTVDIFGKESGGASIISATYLPNPTNVRLIGIGSDAVLVWDSVNPESLVNHYAIYQSKNLITDVSELSPVATRKGTSIPLDIIETYIDQYFAVATVNISGAQDPNVVSVPTTSCSNGTIDLRDLIIVLQIIAGSDIYGTCPDAGITDTQTIGLREAIYIIKNLSSY